MAPFGTYSNRWHKGAMAQMPDGSIWCFSCGDAAGIMSLVIIRNGGVAYSDKLFLVAHQGELSPNSELPVVRAIPVADGVLVTFQNAQETIRSIDPFIKSTFISVMHVDMQMNKEIIALSPTETERSTRHCLGLNDDGWWIAYPEMNDIYANWERLAVYYQNGDYEYLGDVADASPTYKLNAMVDVGGKLVARMKDGYIRMFDIGVVGPEPPPEPPPPPPPDDGKHGHGWGKGGKPK